VLGSPDLARERGRLAVALGAEALERVGREPLSRAIAAEMGRGSLARLRPKEVRPALGAAAPALAVALGVPLPVDFGAP
jgi:hypothetical protein